MRIRSCTTALLAVILVAAAACSSDTSNSKTTKTATTIAQLSTATTAPAVATTLATTATTATVPATSPTALALDARWMWPSEFISATNPDVEQFSLPTINQQAEVVLVVESPNKPPLTVLATSTTDGTLWSATVPQTALGDVTTIVIHIEATTTVGTARSAVRTIAVIPGAVEIAPLIVTPTPATRLIPWGAGDNQVGNIDPGGIFVRQTPASILDDGDATWIVDRANQRVVRMQTDGTFSAVAMPADDFLGDVVLMTGTPYVAVLGSEANNGHGFMTTYLINRSTMAMTTYGPEAVPDGTPSDLPFRWEPATQTLHAEILPDLYPFFTMQPKPRYLIGAPTLSPLHMEATEDGLVKVVNGAASFVMRFPFGPPAIEESVVTDDGSVWFIASVVESTTTDSVITQRVHFFLAHFDATTSTVRAVDLPPTHAATTPLARLETNRRLTVQEGQATVMQGTPDGLVLFSYEL